MLEGLRSRRALWGLGVRFFVFLLFEGALGFSFGLQGLRGLDLFC